MRRLGLYKVLSSHFYVFSFGVAFAIVFLLLAVHSANAISKIFIIVTRTAKISKNTLGNRSH